MTLLYTDGFDEQDVTRDWTAYAPGPSPSYTTGRLAGSCLALNNAGYGSPGGVYRGFPEISSLYLGFAIKLDGLLSGMGGQPQYVQLHGDGGATTHLCIGFNSSGQPVVVRGNDLGGTVLATGASALTIGTWYYIEVYATIANTGGRCTVKVNGVTVIDFTGDTMNGGTLTSIDQIRFYGDGYSTAGSLKTYYDDVYVCDANGTVNNTFLGDIQVQTLLPNGNGASSAWVGSDGNSTDNYLLVDEVPVVTTSYVGSATADAIDEYAFTDVTGTPSVYGVMIRAIAQKTDSGSRSLGLMTRISTTDYVSSDQALAVGFAAVETIQETSPATSSAWTASEVSGAQFGVKVRP